MGPKTGARLCVDSLLIPLGPDGLHSHRSRTDGCDGPRRLAKDVLLGYGKPIQNARQDEQEVPGLSGFLSAA
jgi:hypothetical protein